MPINSGRASNTLTHENLILTLWSTFCYYPHFKHTESEAQQGFTGTKWWGLGLSRTQALNHYNVRVFHKHGGQSQKPREGQQSNRRELSGEGCDFWLLKEMDSSLRILHFTSDILHIKCNPLSYFYSLERPYLHAFKINNVFEKSTFNKPSYINLLQHREQQMWDLTPVQKWVQKWD